MKRTFLACVVWLTASSMLAQVIPGTPFGGGGGAPLSFPLLAPNGSLTAPSYSFTNSTGSGLSYNVIGYLQMGATNGSGTDAGGTNIAISPGAGTGTGAAGLFAVAIAPPAAGSGSTLNTAQNVILVDGANAVFGGIDTHSSGTFVVAAYDRTAGDTNGAAGALQLRGGQGTGTASAGNVTIQVAPPAAGSGSTQNALQTAFQITASTGDIDLTPGLPGGGTRGSISLSGGATGGGLKLDRTITAGGTTGAQTINKMAGTVNFAAAATTLVVTDSIVAATSIVFTTIRTADATCTFVKSVVPAAGSFTITVNAGCTAETSVGFWVTN